MKYLNGKKWLAKDVIFLGINDNYLFGYPIYQFLEKYISIDTDMKRAGTIRTGFAIETLS